MKNRIKIPPSVVESASQLGMEVPQGVKWVDLGEGESPRRKVSGGATAPVVAVAKAITPAEVADLAARKGIHHVIQDGSWNWQRELRATLRLIGYARMQEAPSPVEILLEEPGSEVFEWKVRDSMEKQDILAKFADFLKPKRNTASILDDVMAILDEFYTNAIFNAPTNKQGLKRYAELHREAKPVLPEWEAARMFVAYRPEFLVLGCEDPFGSLVPGRVLEKLRKSYESGVAKSIRQDGGGAGIGFRVVFERSTTLYMIVDPGKRTCVAAVMPLGAAARRESNEIKNIHVVVRGEGGAQDE